MVNVRTRSTKGNPVCTAASGPPAPCVSCRTNGISSAPAIIPAAAKTAACRHQRCHIVRGPDNRRDPGGDLLVPPLDRRRDLTARRIEEEGRQYVQPRDSQQRHPNQGSPFDLL